MRFHEDTPRLSASDLSNHLGCRHLTALDLQAALGRLDPPTWRDPALEVLQQRGFEHESAYLDHLEAQGLKVTRVEADDATTAVEATEEAMRSGVDVIVQATLADGRWLGRADVLRRVETPSQLGPFSYEVQDTKLARETRAGTLLQLCLYSELVGHIQGELPERMHVVTPGNDFRPETFRVRDYLAYHRYVRERLTEAVADASNLDHTYPEPSEQCDVCRWWSACDTRRRDDDHLSLVAGVTKLQRKELADWGVQTLEALAKLPLPLARKPSRGAAESYVRAREQARVQLEGRETKEPVFELLPVEAERGLARLPAPSPGDVFFDIEGDPFVGTAGLEYLLGWVVLDEHGAPVYRSRWALDPAQEKAAFQAFMDEVMARWERHPDLHVYHFAPYEPGAVKRLMGRYATREEEVDRLLRAGVFVDLHTVARQGVRASVEQYSIKDLEPFYDFERAVELREASKHKRALERALELGHPEDAPEDVRGTVEGYNRDDCLSNLRLRDWLEGLRDQLAADGQQIPRPEARDGAPSEELDERQQRIATLMDRLLEGVPADRGDRDEAQQARWLLAHLLDWHRREEKSGWWEYYRLADLDAEDLLDEDVGVGGLEFVGRVEARGRTPVHRYRFRPQETRLKEGDDLRMVGGDAVGKVAGIDPKARTLDIKKTGKTADVHPAGVFAHTSVGTGVLKDALLRLGTWVADEGLDAPGAHRAERDLLMARPPRLRSQPAQGAPLQHDGETPLSAARRLALDLDHGVLPIQGPPGAGKTFTGARMICDLVRAGKKVGITATSHKVVRNLLDKVVEAADEEGLSVRCLQKVSGKPAKDGLVREEKDNGKTLDALRDDEVDVVGGTAWLWARDAMAEAVDVLFVDEAGQMSLANVLAVAQGAHSLVLLGDPQQLEQPSQGVHPEGAGVSALEHLLGEGQTLPKDRGLFLPKTWRLHPNICELTSELFYDGRLESRPELESQALHGDTPFAGAGLWYVPVAHEGNQNLSQEEVDRVADLYASLTSGKVTWTDAEGQQAPLTAEDVLVVTPYNAQVRALSDRLPDARVGTVDKFQGQEAPVVIYSMATSSQDEAPRGMEFLFSLNRLNVATSRARCASILVANPRLFELECRTPRQMQLANGFCRYLEMATTQD